jgi:hypothetical protein
MLELLTTRRLYAGASHNAEVVCWILSQSGSRMLGPVRTRWLYAGSSHNSEVVCWSVSQRRDVPGPLTPRVRFVCAFPVIKEILRRGACRSGHSESLF